MNTDKQHIQELLDRYMDGCESQQDLKELREYFFQTTDLPEEWEVYREMFEIETCPQEIPSLEALQKLAGTETHKQSRARLSWIAVAGVAACVLLVFMLQIPKQEDAVSSVQPIEHNLHVAENTMEEQKVPAVSEKMTVTEETSRKKTATPSVPKAKKSIVSQPKPIEQNEEPLETAETSNNHDMTIDEYVEAMIAANMPKMENISIDPIEFQSIIRAKGMELSARASKTINKQEL